MTDLNDKQIKFLQMLLDTKFLEKLTNRTINQALEDVGIMGDDADTNVFVSFIKEILDCGYYGFSTDYKKLNAFGTLYKKYYYVNLVR